MRRHLVGFVGFFAGAVLVLGGCGSVSSTGGTGGSVGASTGGTVGSTGGASGAPGTGGAAGASATGGASGGAGGVAGSAGHQGGGNGGHGGGAGAAGGTGGHAGAGGGTGGHAGASGGTGGHAGAGGGGGGHADAGQTCDELAAAFSAALPKAQSCTPGAANQCGQLTYTAALGQCRGCQSYVNDATALDMLRDQYDQQACPQATLCPAILCIQPRAATCVASDASSGGTCQVSAVLTTSP